MGVLLVKLANTLELYTGFRDPLSLSQCRRETILVETPITDVTIHWACLIGVRRHLVVFDHIVRCSPPLVSVPNREVVDTYNSGICCIPPM